MPLLRRQRAATVLPPLPVVQHTIVSWEPGHVRAAVLRLEDGSAEIIGVAAAPVQSISRSAHPDVDRWAAGCEKALSQAEEMTAQTVGRKVVPDYAIMAIPGELTRLLRVDVDMERRHAGQGITMADVESLVVRGYRLAQDRLSAEEHQLSDEIVDGAIIETYVDGEVVTDPLGLHGARLGLTMSYAVAPLEWVRTLEEVARRAELNLVAVLPHQTAYASPLADPHALLILLHDEHSVVAWLRNGRVQAMGLVEMGQRKIVDDLGGLLNLRGREAESLLQAFRARRLREDFHHYVARAFWVELRRWMAALAEETHRLMGDEALPQHLYFADASRRLPEAMAALQTTYWEKSLPFGCCPEVTELNVGLVRHVLDSTAQAGGPGYLLVRALAHKVAQLYAPANVRDRLLVQTVSCTRATAAPRMR
ncbi:MAG: hypothetical protein V1772_10735 [Chloroflexota bacterium]